MYDKCQNYSKASFVGAAAAAAATTATTTTRPNTHTTSLTLAPYLSQFNATPLFPFHNPFHSTTSYQSHTTPNDSNYDLLKLNKYYSSGTMSLPYKCPFCMSFKDLSSDFIEHLAHTHFQELKCVYEKANEMEMGEVATNVNKIKHDVDVDAVNEQPSSKRMNTSNSSINMDHTLSNKESSSSSSSSSLTESSSTTTGVASSSMHCKICHRGFEYYSNLRRHIKTKHKIFGKQVKDCVIRQKISTSCCTSIISPPQESTSTCCSSPDNIKISSTSTTGSDANTTPSSITTSNTTTTTTNHSLKNIIKTKFQNEQQQSMHSVVNDLCPSPTLSSVSSVTSSEEQVDVSTPQFTSDTGMTNENAYPFQSLARQQALVNSKFKTGLLEALLTNRQQHEQHAQFMSNSSVDTNNELLMQRMNYLRKFFQTIAAQNNYNQHMASLSRQTSVQETMAATASAASIPLVIDETQKENDSQDANEDGQDSNCSYSINSNNNVNKAQSNQIRFSTEVWRCPYCCYETTSASRYNSHLVCHGWKPYLCPHCGSRSNRLPDMRTHISTFHPEHNVNTFVILNEDEAKATLKDYMKNRALINRKLKEMRPQPKFKCKLCPYASLYQFNLTKHVKSVHLTDTYNGNHAVTSNNINNNNANLSQN